jgi:hypothetical protein
VSHDSRRQINARLGRLLCLMALLLPIEAAATSILYSVADLPDQGMGNRVLYTYFVSEREFGSDERFSILFDPNLFSAIELPAPAPGPDWDTLVLQPDDALPSAGRYEGIAMSQAPALPESFTIVAIFDGVGLPGDQPFEIYGSGFDLLESGTTALIPEPGTSILIGLGLGLLARRAPRRRQR